MSVYDLKSGERAQITAVNVSGGALTRLNSLGICTGKQVTALCFSLFKSSILISCGGVRLGLRKAIAKNIEVALCA
ncbi:MAG: ferrous iron transport protein A [Clostridia bacterium]|nr:ferrous iron transport protein A [Clostridia bacterium]